MKRLALAMALLAGCDFVIQHPVAFDVADSVVLASATTVAVADRRDGAVSGAAIGAGVFAIAAIPFLVMITVLSRWRPS